MSPVSPKSKQKPKQPAKRGRPAHPQRGRVFLRVDEEELAAWEAQAERLGVPLSTWVRMTCNERVR